MGMEFKIRAYMIAKVVVVMTAIAFIGVNVSQEFTLTLIRNRHMTNILLGISILSIAFILMQRRTYLPFLDRMVLPATVLTPVNIAEKSFAGTDAKKVDVQINAPRARYIIWWAAEPYTGKKDPKKQVTPKDLAKWASKTSPNVAYNKYRNAGIAEVVNGVAKINLYCPRMYSVSGGDMILPRHVHYREALWNGFASEVKTINVNC